MQVEARLKCDQVSKHYIWTHPLWYLGVNSSHPSLADSKDLACNPVCTLRQADNCHPFENWSSTPLKYNWLVRWEGMKVESKKCIGKVKWFNIRSVWDDRQKLGHKLLESQAEASGFSPEDTGCYSWMLMGGITWSYLHFEKSHHHGDIFVSFNPWYVLKYWLEHRLPMWSWMNH